MRVVCIRLKSAVDAQSVAEIFYRATPQILIRKPNIIFLEISKCRNLYSEQTFLKRTHVTLKRIGILAQVSIADDIPTALSVSMLSPPHHPASDRNSLPIEALAYYIDPLNCFPEQMGFIHSTIRTLKLLRICTLNDFLNIPSHEISPRFGPLVLLGYQRIAGEHDLPWATFIPRETVSEDCEFDLSHPPRDLEPIYFSLRPLLEKMHLRLRGKGRRARQFKVTLHQEYATQKTPQMYDVLIIIPLSFVSVKTIFQITKEKLDTAVHRQPLEHAIVKLSVVVTEEVPYVTAQKDIFDQKKEETSEAFFHLVSRIATKLGTESVFFADIKESYLPERNWFRGLSLKRDRTLLSSDSAKYADAESGKDRNRDNKRDSVIPERPLRLLKEPTPVSVFNNKLFWQQTTYPITAWKNQEVVLSNWWEISGGERVYYKLFTASGDIFWIFKNKENYFLHGVFE